MSCRRSLALLAALLLPGPALFSTDPPHDASKSIQCLTCHKAHGALGGALTFVSGNANLCLSCHVSGGSATAKAFATTDQALPTGGLPTGTTATGNSHRWDSGPAGRVAKGTPNTSTGTITPVGAYTGAYPTTIQIKISTAGSVGIAKFDWQMTVNGTSTYGAATTGVVTNVGNVPLGTTGIAVRFADGASSPSFVLNDIFLLYARTELRTPTSAFLTPFIQNGLIMCSTCHDQHSQAAKPFDPASSQTYTAGVTNNRHFQRIANDTGQMCVDCHNARNQTVKGGTTHPIALAIPATTDYKTPTTALLDTSTPTKLVRCQSCHKVHYAPTTDGSLIRVTNAANALCDDCHTYKTAATKGIHFDATLGAVWPGGQYGSTITTYAARTAAERGNCANCHHPHGWPDARDTTKHYAKMLVDEPSNLCLTCHDATPQGAATNVQVEIIKTNHHPVERPPTWVNGRTVSCGDCHNPHKALKGNHTYATTATATRNAISGSPVLTGVDGVTPTYSANWTAPTYAAAATATAEYQVCMKCHTSYAGSFGATPPAGMTAFYNTGTARFTNGSTTVTGTGTTWNAGMVGAWIHKSPTTPAYRISAFVSATSLTLATAYAEATDATAAAYILTQETDVGMEFNPKNASFHPVVAGLTASGSGSTALPAARLKAPFATSPGTQTMMCSDCHNTDGVAAQGPHGSAAQFMLRTFSGGAPTANWPNVTLTNARSGTVANQSWCNNCHPIQTSTNNVHTTGNHGSTQCYKCHIVVPHGGKLGRLIATNTANMPARYAFNNLKSNSYLRAFVKTSGSYSESNCGSAQSGCTNHSLASSGTNSW